MPSPRKSAAVPAIDLALQGGGSHGAFTWGVLDRLLEEPSIAFDGVCGTSAGALNAGVLASGYAKGGRDGARAALASFWQEVSGASGCFGAWTAPSPPFGLAMFNLDANPFYQWFNQLSRAFAPAQLNPLGLDPLRAVVRRHVDEAALRAGPLTVFATATSVRTGQARVFHGAELSVEALLASACLPQMFSPVVIDGEAYWDGGYSGNPALWPLIYNTPALDIVLVQINPLVRPGLPASADEIADRVNEITFNAGLVAEMRAIAFVQRLVGQGRLDAAEYKNLRLHMVADFKAMAPLDQSSKLNTDWSFLQDLQRLGRAAAARWLAAHRGDIGRRSTLDIERTFLSPRQADLPWAAD